MVGAASSLPMTRSLGSPSRPRGQSADCFGSEQGQGASEEREGCSVSPFSPLPLCQGRNHCMVHTGASCHLRTKTRLKIKKHHSPIPQSRNGKDVRPCYPLKAGGDSFLKVELQLRLANRQPSLFYSFGNAGLCLDS